MKRYVRSAVDNYLDKDMGYRAMVADHTSSQREIALLAKDPEEFVRACIASNPYTSGEILTKLAKDPAVRVRMHVAKNPHTPVSSLNKLCESDSYDVVRDYALNTLAVLDLRRHHAST